MSDDQTAIRPPKSLVNASQIDGYIDGLMTAREGGPEIVPDCFSPMASWSWRDGYAVGRQEAING